MNGKLTSWKLVRIRLTVPTSMSFNKPKGWWVGWPLVFWSFFAAAVLVDVLQIKAYQLLQTRSHRVRKTATHRQSLHIDGDHTNKCSNFFSIVLTRESRNTVILAQMLCFVCRSPVAMLLCHVVCHEVWLVTVRIQAEIFPLPISRFGRFCSVNLYLILSFTLLSLLWPSL
jgi:hypothetical protein